MKNKSVYIFFSLFLVILTASCSSLTDNNLIKYDEARFYAASVELEFNINCLTLSPGSSETQINFSWHSHDGIGIVLIREYYADSDFIYEAESVFVNAAFGYSHKAVVTDLKTETTYLYKISNGVTESSDFKITVGNTNNFSFFVVGDPQLTGSAINALQWKNTINKAVTTFPEASFIVSCGDQTDASSINHTEIKYAAYLAPPELKNLPAAQSLGNHDAVYMTAYANHFNNPNPDSFNYWFKYGNSLFMVLDSNISDIETHKKFIEQAINSNPDCIWKILVFHHSIYSEGEHHNSLYQIFQKNTWVPVFDRLGIDVVFAGHDHAYSRTHPMRADRINPRGIVYLSLNSSSGSKYYDWGNRNQASFTAVRSQNQRPQFTKVDATDFSLTITTFEIMDDGEVYMVDSYKIN